MVSYVFPPIAYVGTHRSLRFCRYLPENGWLPRVLTINETKDLENDYELFKRIPLEVKVYRTPTVDFWRLHNAKQKRKAIKKAQAATSFQKASTKSKKTKTRTFFNRLKVLFWELLTIPDHMVFWIPFGVLKGIRVQHQEKCDVIYTTSPPHSEHIIGLILSKLFRKPWVADFRDPILDSSGYNPVSYLRFWVDRSLEKLIVKNADKVLVISENYKTIIINRYPKFENKFIYLPNGYDPQLFKRTPEESFNKFTILYSGSFYANRSPEFFLRSFSQWIKQKPPEIRQQVQVFIYGLPSSLAETIILEEELEDTVFFKGMISQDKIISKQKGAHILLLIIGFDAESRGTITSKVFEYIACDRPILAIIPEGDAADILKEYHAYLPVNSEDKNLLIKTLDKAFNDYCTNSSSDSTVSKEFSNERLYNTFNVRNQTRRLSSIFNGVTRQTLKTDNNKKILFISYVYPPIAYAGTYRSLRLSKYLSKLGYKVVVLSINIQKDLYNDFNLLNDIKSRVHIYRSKTFDPWRIYQQIKSKFLTNYIGRLFDKVISLFLRLINIPDHMIYWVPFALQRAFYLVKKYNISVIYTTSPPHSEHIVGLILKRITNVKWVADFRDPILDNQAAEDWTWHERTINAKLEKLIVKYADSIILNTNAAENRFIKRYDISKTCTIRNSFDEDDFLNLPQKKYKRFTLAHVGSMYSFRKADNLLKAIKLLADQKLIAPTNFRMIFVGLNDEHLKTSIIRFGVERYIELKPMVSHAEAIRIMARSHLLILLKGFGGNSNAQIPGKLFEYLGTGNKILTIAPKNSEAAKIIKSKGVGFVIEDDINELARVLIDEFKKYSVKKKLNFNLNVLNEFSSSEMAKQFVNIIERLK